MCLRASSFGVKVSQRVSRNRGGREARRFREASQPKPQVKQARADFPMFELVPQEKIELIRNYSPYIQSGKSTLC